MRCHIGGLPAVALCLALGAALLTVSAVPLQAEGRQVTISASGSAALSAPVTRAKPARLVLASAQPARAQPAWAQPARSRAGGFDWLAKRQVAGAAVVPASGQRALPREIGRGSWICSPAGFGRKSRCHAN